jgi:hypothetical protein
MLDLRTQTAAADELTHAAAEIEASDPARADFAQAAGDSESSPSRLSRSRDG